VAGPKDDVRNGDTKGASAAKIDMILEAAVIPVSNVDRAKGFYGSFG
jgi:hypothetical protein